MSSDDLERIDPTLDRLSRRQALRRLGLIGAAAAAGPSVLAACGSGGGGSSATTVGGTTVGGTAAPGSAAAAAAASENRSPRCCRSTRAARTARAPTRARRRAAAHRHRLVLRQDDEPRTRPRGQAHRGGRRSEDQVHVYLDHKSGDAAAGMQAMTELGAAKVPAKFASYVDDLGAMLAGTAQYKMFTLDGGGGTSIFGQGQPYFWGTRAITPERPDAGPVQVDEGDAARRQDGRPRSAGTSASRTTAIVKDDILEEDRRRPATSYNGLYELVPVGGQDFSPGAPEDQGQRARHPARRASTARTPVRSSTRRRRPGSKATLYRLRVHARRRQRLEGHLRQRRLHVRLRLLRRRTTRRARSPRCSSTEFKKEYGEDPDFYAANFYENTFVMWEVIRRVLAKGGDINDGDAPRQGAAGEPHRRQRLRRRRQRPSAPTPSTRRPTR